MKSGLTLQSVTPQIPVDYKPTPECRLEMVDLSIVEKTMRQLSETSHGAPHSSFAMTESDTKLPLLTRARIVAVSQHFVTAAAHTTIFILARASEALDAATSHKTLKLEHAAAMTGTGVLCASTALDALAAAGAFLNRGKSAKDIKDTQWLPTLANMSETLRPFLDHVRTLQGCITNVAMFGAISSAGALWATRQSIVDAMPPPLVDDEVSPAPNTMQAPSTSNALECAQLVATVASTTIRAIMPPLVTTCVNRDEAKQSRHRYNVVEGPQPEDYGPVEPIQFTRIEDAPRIGANWA